MLHSKGLTTMLNPDLLRVLDQKNPTIPVVQSVVFLTFMTTLGSESTALQLEQSFWLCFLQKESSLSSPTKCLAIEPRHGTPEELGYHSNPRCSSTASDFY